MPHDSLTATAHRPWPLPTSNWVWRQTWYELLFAHWPVSPDLLLRHIPSGVELQEFEGSAWLGIVPFKMSGIAKRGFPDLPWFSAFAELNVRTYVTVNGKPGVWFFSLDATNWLAVWGARRFFHLPYFQADIQVTSGDQGTEYRCRRGDGRAEFSGCYRATSPAFEPEPGTLEYFLTERYCLFCQNRRGDILRADVHHRPWPLQQAEATIDVNSMTAPLDISLAGEPLLHYAAGVDAIVWSPRPAFG